MNLFRLPLIHNHYHIGMTIEIIISNFDTNRYLIERSRKLLDQREGHTITELNRQ